MLQVRHSQSFNDTPVKAWVVIAEDGMIRTAHCNCMAGLDECCSHAAAIMFAVLSAVEIKNGTACTSQKQKWQEPPRKTLDKVQYEEGRHILFTTAERRKKLKIDSEPANETIHIPKLTEDEEQQFYSDLAASEEKEKVPVKSAILSIIPNHAQRFIPKAVQLDLPPPLTDLYLDDNRDLPDDDLAKACDDAFENMHITQEQVIIFLLTSVVFIMHRVNFSYFLLTTLLDLTSDYISGDRNNIESYFIRVILICL